MAVVIFRDFQEMFTHAIHESTFSLAYVLFTADAAGNAIYQITAFAVYVRFALI